MRDGFFSALPQLGSLIFVLSTGYVADYIVHREIVRAITARKLFHAIGTISPAICLLIISFLNCTRRYLAVGLLTVGVALSGIMISGSYIVNVGDFSGIYSGIVFAICNTVSSFGGFCAPYITNVITRHKTTAQWRIAFLSYTGSFIISFIVFILLAQGEIQPWAKDKNDNSDGDVELRKDLFESDDKNDIVT
ncbi:unnamed protein product [Didymodactylos carnosus]|uniref:Major facilitator superfamily (MFS) profile domain-containing protein n=1 Tax=Didymodactylos carnosus TaxID=1234261 RepID=A0A8S2QYW3_9BILA|nr:unnamed protein product [Didymodactylos carnosus]CAF4132818.1 unnamed protein product [Didymodactylos carnosus]